MLWAHGMQSFSKHCILWMIWGVSTYNQDQLAFLLYSVIRVFWILVFMSSFLTWARSVYPSFFQLSLWSQLGEVMLFFFFFLEGTCVVVHSKNEQNGKTTILETSCILLIMIASLQSGMIISELFVCRFVIVLEEEDKMLIGLTYLFTIKIPVVSFGLSL